MVTQGIPTSSDIYLEVNGRKVAVVQSYTAQTTVQNINTFFERGVCENELCYHCGKVDSCRKKRMEKCF